VHPKRLPRSAPPKSTPETKPDGAAKTAPQGKLSTAE